MALYAIGDLHLSLGAPKPMDVFGGAWVGYMDKLAEGVTSITENDTTVLLGDLSWALKPEDAVDDFLFLEALPGKKLIGKGNHDFWWATQAKLKALWEKHNIHSVELLYNNAYRFDSCIVCGTRGWFLDETQQHTVGEVNYAKIVNREVIRLRLSLEEARKLQDTEGEPLPIAVFLHFPPVWNDFVCREIVDVLLEYQVKTCYFGHIHGAYYAPRTRSFEGIDFVLCAADYLNFAPLPVFVG